MKNAGSFRKNIFRTIRKSLSRYLAIVGIIALGAGFFAGLRVTKSAMVETADQYYDELNFYDFRLLSTLGFTDDDVAAAAGVSGVECAEGSVTSDFICESENGENFVLRAHSITKSVNALKLVSGRMPEKADECLLDAFYYDDDSLGTVLKVSSNNDEDTRDMFAYGEYTVVGLVYSPYYLNYERGTTTLGTGSVKAFVYIPYDGFDADCYTELYVKLTDSPKIYTDEYKEAADTVKETLTEAAEARGEGRLSEVTTEYQQKIDDARADLDEGWDDYYSGKEEGQAKLDDAWKQLADARASLSDGWEQLESGRSQLEKTVFETNKKLEDSQSELQDAYNTLTASEADYQDGLAKYNDGYAQYQQGLSDYESGMDEYDKGKDTLNDSYNQLMQSQIQLENAKRQLDEAENYYSAISGIYALAGSLKDTANSSGFSFASPEDYSAALYSAASYMSGSDVQHALAVYNLSTGVLSGFSMTPPSFLAAYPGLPDETRSQILAAVNAAGAAYGIQYATADEYCADLNAAVSTLNTPESVSAQSLYSLSDSALSGYVSSYDGSLKVQGFLTDWQYAGAALDASLDSLIGSGTYEMNAINIAKMRSALNAASSEYVSGNAALTSGWQQYDDAVKTLNSSKDQLDDAKATLDETQKTLEDSKKQLDDARAKLDSGWSDYKTGKEQLDQGWEQLNSETAKAKKKLDDAETELNSGETEYADGLSDYADGLREFHTETSDALAKLQDGESDLSDAEKKLDELEPAEIYVLGREENTGYSCFENDSEIVEGVAKVFPLFFFIVAALVCITTMTRMVYEERTQIGVLKALGYGDAAIVSKYLIYAGSASIIGCTAGLWFGSIVFPKILWMGYSIMYGFADIVFVFDMPLAVAITVAYTSVTLAATWLSCRGELSEAPSELIRPRSPRPGKRVLLERITFIWNRMTFLHKVSFRNIFRYKNRLVMMILGIGGCTALLLTGFGINDSIKNFVDFQFDEISVYDCAVTFSDPMDAQSESDFVRECGSSIDGAVFLHMSSISVDMGGTVKSAYLVATNDSLDGFMDFHSGSEPVAYPKTGECIVSRKIAEVYDLAVGDSVTFRDSDMNYLTLKVSGVFDNYVYNYIYTDLDSLSTWKGSSDIKGAFINLPSGSDKHAAAAEISGVSGVSSITLNADLQDRVNSMLQSMNYIVATVVLCAGALAFIVLYNLTNININERIREIATIKVLGFYPGETAAYVFRENTVLTIIASIIGLPAGVLLHSYVMSQITLDSVMFCVRIYPMSFVYSVALTLVFTAVVDLFMYFGLNRIDMAESLKSVE